MILPTSNEVLSFLAVLVGAGPLLGLIVISCVLAWMQSRRPHH